MPLSQSIGLDTLSKYFHLPINDVAKELGVCATVLKKICRKNGIPRWPHRKIKSLDKMVGSLEASVAKNPEDEERIKQEIATLRNKRNFLMKNPNVLAGKPGHSKKVKQVPQNLIHLVVPPRQFVSNTYASPMHLHPLASALYIQMTHPHIPYPMISTPPNGVSFCPPAIGETQWNFSVDRLSAFSHPKSLHQQNFSVSSPPLEDPPLVPQSQFSIRLPKLRIPEENDNTNGTHLATMEPELFLLPQNTENPPAKWQLPSWFEHEHDKVLRARNEQGEVLDGDNSNINMVGNGSQSQQQFEEQPSSDRVRVKVETEERGQPPPSPS